MVGEAPMTIGSMIDTFNSAYKRDINTIISTGILEGKTTKEMARAVTSVSNSRSRRQAEALVRTIVNHTGASARKRTFADHQELFIGERFLTTLDSRTSAPCILNSDKIFPFNQGPFPPLHYNCRSVRVPELKDEYKIIKDDTRASVNGPVPEETTYNSWLKRQPKTVQNEVLGEARAKAWRNSGVKLDRFVDNTGKFYTLDELKTLDLI
jgi:SPP1 gp7 family putative phage head morphogenesis protein